MTQINVCQRQEVIDWLQKYGYPVLPVAPAQDARQHPKVVQADSKKGVWQHCPLTPDFQPMPLYTGKNPSYLDREGKLHLVNHRQYQNRLPSKKELKIWFANPLNGIGTLGGWNDTVWLDFDVKQFLSKPECDDAALEIALKVREHSGSEPFLERSHSGGWRIGVRVRQKPGFTNFALAPGGKHIGEALFEGRFTVLAPTIGPSGNPYESLNRVAPPLIESLECIGIDSTKSSREKQSQDLTPPSLNFGSTPGTIPLEVLGNRTSREILAGGNSKGDRSDSLTTAINEWHGWINWTKRNGVTISGNPEELAHHAGERLGLDTDRIDRILKSVNGVSLEPAALRVGGEEACWKKVRNLDKATFDSKCPASLKDVIKHGKTANRSSDTEVHADGSNDSTKERAAAVALLEKEPEPQQESNIEFLQKALNFLYGDKHWISVEGKVYCWTGKYYKYKKDVVELRRIRDFCNAYPVSTKDGIRFPYANPAKVYETLSWIKLSLAVDEDLVNPPGLNCTNGVLLLEWSLIEFNPVPTWRLVPHTPDFYYIYEPIVTYDPGANSSSCDRLLEVLDAQEQDIFLKTIAASLDLPTIRKYKGRMVRALLLKGHGSNGKDTLREVVAAMYGYQGMTGKTLSDFAAYDNGRKFSIAPLKYSRVNWASENTNTTRLDKIQSAKAFITGDPLDSERKGKDEEPFKPKGVALFNMNDTPNLRGTLEAIAGRYAVLTFNKTFKIGADPSKGELEADPRFKDDLAFLRTQVLPAFLNKVLDALTQLMTEGINYDCTHKALEDIQAENSHLFQFCQDTGLGYDPEGVQTAGEIWERLEQWYIDNGTLTYEETANGKHKPVWIEQASRGDRNVKGANQIIPRFQQLFPKAKRVTVGKGKMALQGISFAPPPPGGGKPEKPTGEAIVSQSVSLNPLPDMDGEPVTPVSLSEDAVDDVKCSSSQASSDLEAQFSSTVSQDEQLPRLPHHSDVAMDAASPGVSPTASVQSETASPLLEKNEAEISDTSISEGGQRDTLDKKPEQSVKEPSVKPGSETDYSTFPHRASDNLQAKIKLAARIREQLLAATDKEKLAAVKQEHGANQVNWVHDSLLTFSEREKVKATGQTEQLNLLDHSYCSESPQSSDPWLERGNLESMAQSLDGCLDRDTLADLRLCWPGYAMNAACKLLSAEKHFQITQWVLELNRLAAGN
jgi:phage/plasmid-associated DNA primase